MKKKRFFEKKKNSFIKKSVKYFYSFYRFFSCENNFFKINFLTKYLNWINLKLKGLKWISAKLRGCKLHFSLFISPFKAYKSWSPLFLHDHIFSRILCHNGLTWQIMTSCLLLLHWLITTHNQPLRTATTKYMWSYNYSFLHALDRKQKPH